MAIKKGSVNLNTEAIAKKSNESAKIDSVIKSIAISDLVPNPENTFRNESDSEKAEIRELADTILLVGWQNGVNSPKVFPTDNGKYMLESGHRRYWAICLLNESGEYKAKFGSDIERIECVVSTATDPLTLIISNITRKQSIGNKARMIGSAIEMYEKKFGKKPTRKELCTLVSAEGVSEANIDRYKAFLTFPTDIQAYVDSEKGGMHYLDNGFQTLAYEVQKKVILIIEEARAEGRNANRDFVKKIVDFAKNGKTSWEEIKKELDFMNPPTSPLNEALKGQTFGINAEPSESRSDDDTHGNRNDEVAHDTMSDIADEIEADAKAEKEAKEKHTKTAEEKKAEVGANITKGISNVAKMLDADFFSFDNDAVAFSDIMSGITTILDRLSQEAVSEEWSDEAREALKKNFKMLTKNIEEFNKTIKEFSE